MKLEINGLTKKYKDKTVLKNISLNVKKGEVISIIGKSGMGKSTLLKCINGMETISSGSISLDNINIDKIKPSLLRQKIGIVFQDYNLFDNLNVIENLTIGLIKIKNLNRAKAYENARLMLKKLKLEEYEKYYPNQLSGGQRQRIAIGRTLLMKTEIILLDEPTSALDYEMKQSIIDLITKMAKDNMTLIIVSHEMDFVNKVSDKVYILKNKKLELKND
jgi:ABC-type polar amino acid transport system ATPase subunit